MKTIFSLVAAIAFFLVGSANATSKPLLCSKDNHRDKGAFSASLGFLYQLNNYNLYRNSDVGTNLSSGANNVGFNLDSRLNLTGKAWANLYFEALWTVGLQNIGAQAPYDHNFNYNVKATLGYDVWSYKSVDVSLYGGLYHRGLVSYDTGTNAFQQNITAATLGTELTHYSDIAVSRMFLEGYIGGFYGHDTMTGTTSSSNYPAGGFGLGFSTDIEVSKNFFIKPNTKFEMLFIGDRTYSNGGSLASITQIQLFTFGIGLGWK